MIVKKIEWLSKVSKEAILFVGEKPKQCRVFCHPCTLNSGDIIQFPLFAISVQDLFRVDKSESLSIKKGNDKLSHIVVAQVDDIKSSIVSVNEIKIELDEALPGDININDKIQFYCNRLDII